MCVGVGVFGVCRCMSLVSGYFLCVVFVLVVILPPLAGLSEDKITYGFFLRKFLYTKNR